MATKWKPSHSDSMVKIKIPLLVALLVFGQNLASTHAEPVYPPVDVLLQADTTTIGEPIHYPEGQAQITVAIVTMEIGQSTGWHRHDAPLTAHILQGELSVDYGTSGLRVYRAGDTFVEALGSTHQGKNTGEEKARILVVFSGALGTENTTQE